MCLAKTDAGFPIGVEPRLAETNHLWQEHLTHEMPFGLQKSSYSSVYIHMIRC